MTNPGNSSSGTVTLVLQPGGDTSGTSPLLIALVRQYRGRWINQWRVYPELDYMNGSSTGLIPTLFASKTDFDGRFELETLPRYDIVYIYKDFDFVTPGLLNALQESGTAIVYNPGDNPAGTRMDFRSPEAIPFMRALDGIVLASPAQREAVSGFRQAGTILLDPPVLNDVHKTDYSASDPIRIIWQGWAHNLRPMESLHPVYERLRRDVGINLDLLYHCDSPTPGMELDFVRYERWTEELVFRRLAESDIAVTAKDRADPVQMNKPPTKVLSYMAAGLPLVAIPSPADEAVIEHGETGFLAYGPEDFYRYLRMLIEDPELRERVGRAAREEALRRASPSNLANAFVNFLRGLKAE